MYAKWGMKRLPLPVPLPSFHTDHTRQEVARSSSHRFFFLLRLNSLKMMLVELGERVHEQMWTTAETMRRRIVNIGDEACKTGAKVQTAGERLRDVAEPAFLDLRDYVSSACEDSTPFNNLKDDDRHAIIEQYLGTAVLLIGLSLGELAGHSSVVQPLLAMVLSPIAAWAVIVLLPIRYALHFRKNAMDDTERRTSVFALAFTLGFLGSFALGGRALLNLAPSLLFIAPTVFALLVDNELVRLPSFPSRYSLFGAALGVTAVASLALGSWPLGSLSATAFLFLLAHFAFLFVHVQVSVARLKEKALCPGFGQLLYIVGVFTIQLLLAAPSTSR